LRNHPSKFTDIQEYILENLTDLDKNNASRKNEMGYSTRTFERDKREISDLFGVSIEYNYFDKVYFINEEIIEDESVKRILDAFSIHHALKQNSQFSPSIYLEKRKTLGTEHINGLLHAIQNHLWITFEHHKFWEDSVTQRKVKPIALKEAQHRWYLIAEDLKDGIIKTFGLDRIKDLNITSNHFKPIDYDVNQAYQHAFGIETYEPAVKMVLQFSWQQGNYIKSFPLHSSQKLISEDEDYKVFEFFMHPTDELKMELLKYGNELTVLEPISLQNELQQRK
jgi:proteasome accessory factor B